MASPVTLLEMRTRVREFADLGPDTTTGRYPNSRLNREINRSWQRAREIAVTNGDGLVYLRQTGPALLPTGPVDDNATWGVIPWPTRAVQIHGIDVKFGDHNIVSLQPMSWGDRNLFSNVGFGVGFANIGPFTGKPVGFCILDIGNEINLDVDGGAIAIFPASDSAYSYIIHYIPVWDDIVEDDHVFNGINGHTDWAIWDCVIKIAAGDSDMSTVYQIAQAERDKAEALLTVRVNRLQRVGPLQRRDVAGQQRWQLSSLRWGHRR